MMYGMVWRLMIRDYNCSSDICRHSHQHQIVNLSASSTGPVAQLSCVLLIHIRSMRMSTAGSVVYTAVLLCYISSSLVSSAVIWSGRTWGDNCSQSTGVSQSDPSSLTVTPGCDRGSIDWHYPQYTRGGLKVSRAVFVCVIYYSICLSVRPKYDRCWLPWW